ncbi:xanthine dehydrogenase family protein molybdopterin-binding subunit [Tropicibacter naphthalenivorans]|uniref:4-hydroxybenzoyl-CoA reductase subunit alpha n=1 Tax=Tropicibacter naphthalenivorans TaxID=441103 RepID=A0A0P1G7K5_9RHOB|nr:xanthine dehydrogenase family protein molybdopterin-binding subunit [Tropicibacter naphthalenivorans]CUH77510.1 4-hydroxybenzoyl-CoA reductase subunit alpha [Tropicibacter naphthalenivorans]SMC56691.1 xanthine dehydrogenase, molybdenum binding subunit apoprotein [Tropicibacter naphthalenivorans]
MAKDGLTEFKLVGTRPDRPDGLDKVTGRARYGADFALPGMLHAAVVRSPHAHARIVSIDTARAEALDGVKAIVTRADFPTGLTGEDWNLQENTIAGDKALYDGHAVAAVAATSKLIAEEAARLIDVTYEVLPHVIDVDDAMADGAPVIREGAADPTVPEGLHPNVVKYMEFGRGDVDAGFSEADLVMEKTYKTEATHQGYIEPHACVGQMGSDDKGEMWVCTQGQWFIRKMCTAVLGIEASQLRVTPSEIGGGFGGKTTIFMEPLSLALSKKAGGKPVKIVMSRSEVLRATGPTASASMDVKIGMKSDGTITAARAEFRMQGGAFPGAPVDMALYCCFAGYKLANVQHIGYDVLANRPKCAAYRAPGSPMGAFAVESLVDEMCRALALDPVEVRLKNGVVTGDQASYGPKFGSIGLKEVLEAVKDHPQLSAPLAENQGRGFAVGYWFNHNGETSVSMAIGEDGTAQVSVGTPDIGGSRASVALMVAETLGIPYEDVRVNVVETGALGVNEPTHGSRATFATGKAAVEATQGAIKEMCRRAAADWGIEAEAVEWADGAAQPAGPNAGKFPPMTIKEIAAKMGSTGGPISGHHESVPDGVGASFGAHVVDLEVDPETGRVTILRYLVVQDAGRAIHPSYVEGQYQGGAAQGIGWALNEEYVYDDKGRLANPVFLDYRVPVASDLPMIDTVIVEVPNPGHPFGVRGVGETGITPPLPAIANAIEDAVGVRMTHLPINPPKLLAALKAR